MKSRIGLFRIKYLERIERDGVVREPSIGEEATVLAEDVEAAITKLRASLRAGVTVRSVVSAEWVAWVSCA